MLFLFVLSVALPSPAQKTPGSMFEKLKYSNGKAVMPYRLLRPADVRAKETFPLVIFLHGAGERGTDNEANIRHIAPLFSNPEYRARYPCYVLAPQCPENMMWAGHDRGPGGLLMRSDPTAPMTLVLELLDRIEKEYPIDRTRIYVTGLSMGGFGTWDLLARFPHRFAAAVPVCGGGDVSTAHTFRHVPVWAFHGALDKVVAPRQSRAMVSALQESGGTPGYTEYPHAGHDSWEYAYRDPLLLPWLFGQQRGENSPAK